MSRTLFRLEIPQDVQDENLDGRELTRRGFAVDKFAGQSTNHTVLQDNSATFGNIAGITVNNDRTITVLNGSAALPQGNWNLIGWKIIIGNDTTTGSLSIVGGQTNVNLNLINCNIEIRNIDTVGSFNTFSIGYGAADAANIRADLQYGASANVSRGINSYGCLWTYSRSSSNQSIRFTDFIDSEIIFVGGEAQLDSSGGGRHIRSTFNKYQGNPSQIRPYGANIIESSIYNNFFFRHGNDGPNQPTQLVIDRPLFLPTGTATPQQAAIDLNVGAVVANSLNSEILGTTITTTSLPVQLIGGPSLSSQNGTLAAIDTFGALDSIDGRMQLRGGVVQSDSVQRCYSGVIQYYGVGDRYFSDSLMTTGAQGIKVRLDTMVNPSGLLSTNAVLGNRMFDTDGTAFTSESTSIIGRTGSDGRLETFQWVNNGGTPQSGRVNWWDWRVETASGSIGTNAWNSNIDGTTSPIGMMIVPICRAYVHSSATNTDADINDLRFEATPVMESRRSFAWNVDQPAVAIQRPNVREELEVPMRTMMAESMIGTAVKAAYVTDGDHNSTLTDQFPGGTSLRQPSLNDIANAFRAEWSDWTTNHTPERQTDTSLAQDLVVDFNHSTHYTVSGSTITIRANGISNTDGDLFREWTFNTINLGTTFVNNQDIIAGTIRNPRSGTVPELAGFSNCKITATVECPRSEVYFHNVDVSDIALTQVSGSGSTTISGTDHNGAALTQNSFSSVTGNFLFATPPIPITVVPDVTEADLQSRRGFWRVVEASGGVLQSIEIGPATTLQEVTYTFFSTHTDTIRAYYQPRCTPGGYVANYGFAEIVPSLQTSTTTVRVTPEDLSALAAETSVDRLNSIEVVQSTLSGQDVLNVGVSGVGTTGVDRIWGQEIAIAIMNTEDYIDTVIARGFNGQQRIIDFVQPFITRYNGGLMDDPSSTPTNPLPQIPVRPVINLFVQGATQRGIINSEGYLTNPTPGNSAFFSLSLIQTVAPVSDIVVAIEGSNTIREIDNKTSYMVTNGASAQADVSIEGGALLGIAPKEDDYNTGTDYTTVT